MNLFNTLCVSAPAGAALLIKLRAAINWKGCEFRVHLQGGARSDSGCIRSEKDLKNLYLNAYQNFWQPSQIGIVTRYYAYLMVDT